MGFPLSNHIQQNILIIDDDDILLLYLQKYLSQNGYRISCLSDGEGIPRKLEQVRFDLLLLDLNLPNKDGFYWLNWLQCYHPALPVVIISAFSGQDQRLLGFQKGAKDYIIKPFHKQELLLRIKNLFCRRQEQTVAIGDLTLDRRNNTVLKNNNDLFLTQLEVNILQLLYLNAGSTLSRDDIMLHIRGVKHNPLDRSIDIHINKIRKKIEKNPSKPTYIHTIRGKGYSFRSATSMA
jgi:DNA-binding response OmpR family regulator